MGGLKLKDPILLLIYQSNFILYEFEWYKFLADWLIRTLTYTFSAYSGPIICQTFLLIWSTIAYIIFACIRWSSAIFVRIAFYCNKIKLDMLIYLTKLLAISISLHFIGNICMNTQNLPGTVHSPLAWQNKPKGHVPLVVPFPVFPPTVHAVEG